jgi:hypothetical protein
VELGLVSSGEVGEKRGGPRAAVTAVLGEIFIHGEGARLGDAYEHSARDAVSEIRVIFDAFERFGFGTFVLADE